MNTETLHPVPAVRPRSRPAGTIDVPGQPSLRSETRLVASLVGGVAITFLPGAWILVGQSSPAFLMFALLIPMSWLLTAILQVVALRFARNDRSPWRSSIAAQCAVVAIVGVATSLLLSPLVSPVSERVGLSGGESWDGWVVAAWTAALTAPFLVWQREGRQREAQASVRLHAVQQAQLAARRSVVETQLQAVEARIDPQHFFDMLDAIEALYRRDTERAEALFDELVVFLRAALPSIDTSSSMLARELDLAAACVRMHALATGDDVVLEIDASRDLLRAPFPPGILLPLLRSVLLAAPGPQALTIFAEQHVGATSDRAARLELGIRAAGPPGQTALVHAAAALHSVYGSAATVRSCAADGRSETRIAIEHDTA